MSTAVNLRVYDQTCAYTCAVNFPPFHLLTGHLVCVVTSAMSMTNNTAVHTV